MRKIVFALLILGCLPGQATPGDPLDVFFGHLMAYDFDAASQVLEEVTPPYGQKLAAIRQFWLHQGQLPATDSLAVIRWLEMGTDQATVYDTLAYGVYTLFNSPYSIDSYRYLNQVLGHELPKVVTQFVYLALLQLYSREIVEVSDHYKVVLDKYYEIMDREDPVDLAWYHIHKMDYYSKDLSAGAVDRFISACDDFETVLPEGRVPFEVGQAYYLFYKIVRYRFEGNEEGVRTCIDRLGRLGRDEPYLKYLHFGSLLWKVQLLAKAGRKEEALRSLDELRGFADSSNLLRSAFIYERFSAVYYYAPMGLFDSAYELLYRSTIRESDLDYRKNSLKLSEMHVRLETAEKEKRLARQEQKLQLRKFQLIGLGTFLLFFGVAGTYVYRSRTLLKRRNQQIETLMRELHHRVKNNLQVISSLLGLQSMKLEDQKARKAVAEGKERIRAMSLIHQKLYQDQDVTAINIKDYLENLVAELARGYGFEDKAKVKVEVPEIPLDADTTLPLGLIVNELVSNAFKYAFEDVDHPELEVSLVKSQDHYTLTVGDNGPGFPEGFSFEEARSFGLKLVRLLVRQLKGELSVRDGQGLTFSVIFGST